MHVPSGNRAQQPAGSIGTTIAGRVEPEKSAIVLGKRALPRNIARLPHRPLPHVHIQPIICRHRNSRTLTHKHSYMGCMREVEA